LTKPSTVFVMHGPTLRGSEEVAAASTQSPRSVLTPSNTQDVHDPHLHRPGRPPPPMRTAPRPHPLLAKFDARLGPLSKDTAERVLALLEGVTALLHP
jgi:hypothetical protein